MADNLQPVSFSESYLSLLLSCREQTTDEAFVWLIKVKSRQPVVRERKRAWERGNLGRSTIGPPLTQAQRPIQPMTVRTAWWLPL